MTMRLKWIGFAMLSIGLVQTSMAGSSSVTGGTVAGTVKVLGAKSDDMPTVVYLTGLQEPPPKEMARLSQRDRKFTPDVLVITKGQRVQFDNEDQVVHNVFSMSSAASFDLGEGKPGFSGQNTFSKTGIIDVYCNIHAAMVATILVLPNRRYAYVGRDGTFKIEGVPPGKYTLFAWRRQANPAKQVIEVQAGAVVDAALVVKVDRESQPHLNKEGKPYSPKSDSDSYY